MTEPETDPQRRRSVCLTWTSRERNHLFAELQERMPAVWDAWSSISRMSRSSSCRQ